MIRVNKLHWFGCIVCLLLGISILSNSAHAKPIPKIRHVFVIMLENEGYSATFGPKSPAFYLRSLAKEGALLPNYYGIGHFSLDNYIAVVSGQAPNPLTQGDCQNFTEFTQSGVGPAGQVLGTGCIYPAAVKTIANQLADSGLSWKAYMEDMGNIPARESGTCGHPPIGDQDDTQDAVRGDQYAVRHDPFVYFHSIIDTSSCNSDVVNLSELKHDLRSTSSTPNLTFITPNLCNDGHDGGDDGRKCVDGQPGGLVSADEFLRVTVPLILKSSAFQQDGLLIITFDEADFDIKLDQRTNKTIAIGDASACCNEQRGPDIPVGSLEDQGPGIVGPGGGRIGAVLVSPFIEPGTVSYIPYNHYSLLRSLEDIFGVAYLGYAGQHGLRAFGMDVFTRPNA